MTAEEDDKAAKRKILVYGGEENVPNSEQLVQSGGSTKTLGNTNERNLQSNRWLDCMDKFADKIQNVQVPSTDNEILKNDIKVALIDDGVGPLRRVTSWEDQRRRILRPRISERKWAKSLLHFQQGSWYCHGRHDLQGLSDG